MPRFFIKEESIRSDGIIICGEDARHISRSLRMKIGDRITVCDFFNYEYDCTIGFIDSESVKLNINDRHPVNTEPSVKVRVFQALPKAQKMELVIQKSVELGACEICPVISSRCISRPDDKSSEKKTKRWNLISEEAAKQSGRGIIPPVRETLSFKQAISEMKKDDLCFICYECEDKLDIKSFLCENYSKNTKSISFFIGPEGGISAEEAELARENGIPSVGLGKRILRTETAPLCVLSGIMFFTDNMI